MGRPRCSDEPRVLTAVRLPESLHHALREAAAVRDVSANLLVTRAVSDFLGQLPSLDHVLDTNEKATT
ncbi:MAG: hypothetical protein ACLPQS_01325 [Acidimicrobiales bacterium]